MIIRKPEPGRLFLRLVITGTLPSHSMMACIYNINYLYIYVYVCREMIIDKYTYSNPESANAWIMKANQPSSTPRSGYIFSFLLVRACPVGAPDTI